jgi:hypothetical protein
MRRILFFLILLFFSALCFAQQNSNLKVIGRIPGAGDDRMYQIQVGAFLISQNAERAFERLNNASLNPAYEKFFSFTRVVINGIAARDVPSYLQRIQNTGFTEVMIRIDNNIPTVQAPVSTAAAQSPVLEEPVIPAAIVEPPPPPVPAARIEQTRLPAVPGPLLPAPENRLPENGYRIGAEGLRRQRNINFSWDAVEGATAYVLTIFRETSQGRSEIFITEPIEQLNFTFDDFRRFENTGNFVWQVEALRRSSQGIIEQRGRPGENTLALNFPHPGQVRTRDTGVLYGN